MFYFFHALPFNITILNVRFWLLKFIALAAFCAGGFFLPEEQKFLEGKERTLNSALLMYFLMLGFFIIIYHQYSLLISHKKCVDTGSNEKRVEVANIALFLPPYF